MGFCQVATIVVFGDGWGEIGVVLWCSIGVCGGSKVVEGGDGSWDFVCGVFYLAWKSKFAYGWVYGWERERIGVVGGGVVTLE